MLELSRLNFVGHLEVPNLLLNLDHRTAMAHHLNRTEVELLSAFATDLEVIVKILGAFTSQNCQKRCSQDARLYPECVAKRTQAEFVN